MTLSEKSAYLKGLMEGMKLDTETNAVSYTHLDVYKRQDLKSAGILYVFQAFQTAGLAEKIRRSAQTQLCGAAVVQI